MWKGAERLGDGHRGGKNCVTEAKKYLTVWGGGGRYNQGTVVSSYRVGNGIFFASS